MGTHEKWLAVLIFLIQCSDVYANPLICSARKSLISNCTGLEAFGCEELDLTNDDRKTCALPKILFVKDKKTDPKNYFYKAANIDCNKTGFWHKTPYYSYSYSIGEAVCADSNPSIVSCVRLNPLHSACDSNMPKSNECNEITEFTEAQHLCSGKSPYIKQPDGTWKVEKQVECDKFTGKWFLSSYWRGYWPRYVEAGENVVCGRQPSSCELCQNFLPAVCYSPSECYPGGNMIHDVGERHCRRATCAEDEYLTTNLAATKYGYKWNETEVKCNKSERWTVDKNEIKWAVCMKKIQCHLNMPLNFDCAGLKEWECEKVYFGSDGSLSCSVSKTLFFKNVTSSTWIPERLIVCDYARGVWIRNPDAMQEDLNANDHIICASIQPSRLPDETSAADYAVTKLSLTIVSLLPIISLI